MAEYDHQLVELVINELRKNNVDVPPSALARSPAAGTTFVSGERREQAIEALKRIGPDKLSPELRAALLAKGCEIY